MHANDAEPIAVPGPDPRAVVALVQAVMSHDWPDGPVERRDYFEGLGLTDGGMLRSEDPRVEEGLLDAPALAAEGMWAGLDGRLFSIGLFLYAEAGKSGITEAGYQALRSGLTAVLGPPEEEDEGQGGESAAFWTGNGVLLELYCHLRDARTVQLGLSHMGLNAEFEALLGPDPE